MEVVRATFWTVLMVAVVTSKPVCLHAEEDSSNSSESSESMSSEETDVQPALADLGLQADPLASSPSSSTLDTAALPGPEDPQTSTDIDPSQPVRENPCQNAFHADNSHDAGEIRSTGTPEETSAHAGLQQEATPPVPMQLLTPTPLLFSTLTAPVEDTPASTPGCFTVQVTTPEPAPSRGDSV